MLLVSEAAKHHFDNLLEQQNVAGLGLRVRALNAGLPTADVELTFCEPDEVQAGDQQQPCGEFVIYIDADSQEWLKMASIDFVTTETGGSLTIKAPGLKGSMPDADANLDEKVRWLLAAEINPQVATHGGNVGLVEITDDKIAVLKFGGGCQGCGMVSVTLQEGIEKTFKEKIPELNGVRDVTDHEAGENPFYE